MFTATPFEPQHFRQINDLTYFRLENGSIAVEGPDNPIIDFSKDAIVYLITIKFGEKTVNLWAREDALYPLTGGSYVKISYHDIEFVDGYTLSNCPDCMYIKYKDLKKKTYGVIYVSDIEISIIINPYEGYKDIQFEDGTIYGEEGCIFYGNTGNEYHTIDEVGKIIDIFKTERKKVSGYNMFYDDSKIYLEDATFEIPYKIFAVEVVRKGKMTLVRVLTPIGAYYYTAKMTLLFGPIKEDQMVEDRATSCYVYVKREENLVQVYHISLVKDTYKWDSITCESGIAVYKFADSNQFFVADKSLYFVGKGDRDFKKLLTDVEADQYVFTEKSREPGRQYDIVAFKDKKPIYWAYYCSRDTEIYSSGELEILCEGYVNGSYVCKMGSQIMGFTASGKILFSTIGQNCHKGKLNRVDQCGKFYADEVYIIEVEPNVIEIYNRVGSQYNTV